MACFTHNSASAMLFNILIVLRLKVDQIFHYCVVWMMIREHSVNAAIKRDYFTAQGLHNFRRNQAGGPIAAIHSHSNCARQLDVF
jgi:hypothetical protein